MLWCWEVLNVFKLVWYRIISYLKPFWQIYFVEFWGNQMVLSMVLVSNLQNDPISTPNNTVCNQYWTILMIWHNLIFIFGAFKSQYYKPLTLLTKSVYSDHIMLRASLVPILLYLSQINLAPGVYILYILSWQSFKSSENNPFSEHLTQKER